MASPSRIASFANFSSFAPARINVGVREVTQRSREIVLGSRAGVTQRVGETARVVATRRALDGISRQRAEHGLGEPLVEERVGADGFNPIGQFVVALAARSAFVIVRDARSGTEDDEVGEATWVA